MVQLLQCKHCKILKNRSLASISATVSTLISRREKGNTAQSEVPANTYVPIYIILAMNAFISSAFVFFQFRLILFLFIFFWEAYRLVTFIIIFKTLLDKNWQKYSPGAENWLKRCFNFHHVRVLKHGDYCTLSDHELFSLLLWTYSSLSSVISPSLPSLTSSFRILCYYLQFHQFHYN